jgi:ketosteroid isomerase-like protein
MPTTAFVRELLDAVDSRDASRFAAHLAPNAVFRFGNAPPVEGREAVRQAVGQFFDSIDGLRHDVIGTWSDGEMVFCQGEVTYTRRDGSTVGPLPFCNVLRTLGGKVKDYLVYVDASSL